MAVKSERKKTIGYFSTPAEPIVKNLKLLWTIGTFFACAVCPVLKVSTLEIKNAVNCLIIKLCFPVYNQW